jgi:drug/metabolite transporter (DMT)-like permease
MRTVAGDTSRALIALHLSVALFGFAALFGKWIALPATVIVLGRTLTAAATLAMVAALRAQRPGRGGRTLLANGAILALHWVSFFAAVQVAGVAIALLGYAVFPVFVLLLDRSDIVRGGSRQWATTLLAAVGMVALVPDLSWTNSATRGLALALISGCTFAWLIVRNRALVARRSAADIALWQNLFAALCLLPVVAIVDRNATWPSLSDVALLLVLGVVCTGFAHTLFIASMRRVSAHTASIVAALEPVYGIALAAWLLGEIPGARTIAGGALIVAAALLASRYVDNGGALPVSIASGKSDT